MFTEVKAFSILPCPDGVVNVIEISEVDLQTLSIDATKIKTQEEMKMIPKTREQIEELRTLAEPLVEWLHKNANPHSLITITQTSCELLSGEIGIPYEPAD